MKTKGCLYVDKSELHGYGVFTEQPLTEGEVIEETLYLKCDDCISLGDYVFHIPNTNKIVLPLGNLVIYNHSFEPNITTFFEGDVVKVKTLKDININEELVWNYGKHYWDYREEVPI